MTHPVRRKLFDAVMDGFLIGNTHARSLFTSEEGDALLRDMDVEEDGEEEEVEPQRLLYLGIGDVRNALSTLAAVPTAAPLEVVANDASAMVLARDVLMLMLAATRPPQHAVALWSDWKLDEDTYAALREVLGVLLEQGPPPWIVTARSTWTQLAQHWHAWRRAPSDLDADMGVRGSALRGSFVGHGRAGVSQAWLSAGVASCSGAQADARRATNPTLYDLSEEGACRFVERQGPGGAFACLQGLHIGGSAFAQQLHLAWAPLLRALARRVAAGTVTFRVVAGDCVALLQSGGFGGDFLAVDTSNLMDYVGLWNLLPLAQRCLASAGGSASGGGPGRRGRPRAFVFTEKIMGVATSHDDMLAALATGTPAFARALARLMGLRLEPVPAALEPVHAEKVVHARWLRHQPAATDYAPVPAADKARLVQDVLGLIAEGSDKAEANAEAKAKIEKRTQKKTKKKKAEAVAAAPAPSQARLEALWWQELQGLCGALRECPPRHRASYAAELVTGVEASAEDASGTSSSSSDEELRSSFQSEFFSFLRAVLVPLPMSPAMAADGREALEQAYPFPSHTAATALLVVGAALRHAPGRRLLRGALDTFFQDPALFDFDHIRNRTLAVLLECAEANDALLPALTQASAPGALLACRTLRVRVDPLEDILRPRGGVLEPALAAFLVRDAGVFAKLAKRSGMFGRSSRPAERESRGRRAEAEADAVGQESSHEHGDDVNLAFDFVRSCPAQALQVIDNVAFDAKSLTLTLRLPATVLDEFELLALVDVQQYRVIARPVKLRDALAQSQSLLAAGLEAQAPPSPSSAPDSLSLSVEDGASLRSVSALKREAAGAAATLAVAGSRKKARRRQK